MDSRIKTFLLLLVLTVIIMFLGSLFRTTGLIIALVFVLGMNLITYFFADKIVLGLYRAKPAPKGHWIHGLVEDVSKKTHIPKPRVYFVPSKIQNAFATGRNPKNAVVAVTDGIMDALTKDELKGVIAHEIGHIKNKDILIMTIVATLAGVIMFIGNMMRWSAIFGGTDNENAGSIIALLVLSILAPLIVILVQLSISRTREYGADKAGASFIGTGKPLASALLKLEKGPKLRGGAEGTSHLFIVNPLKKGGISSLFSTHPPVEERVKRLKEMEF